MKFAQVRGTQVVKMATEKSGSIFLFYFKKNKKKQNINLGVLLNPAPPLVYLAGIFVCFDVVRVYLLFSTTLCSVMLDVCMCL